MRILGIIPARGGSKGIPRKNLTQLGRKTLLEITIECAHKSNVLERLILSTDDEEIANVGKGLKVEVPFMRPHHLAADDTPDFEVFLNVVTWLKKNENYDADIVVWLRPTSPFRSAGDISGSIDLLKETGADSVRTITKVNHHPYWMKILDDDLNIKPIIDGFDERKYHRRQLLPEVFRLNGAVEVIRVEAALRHNHLYGKCTKGFVMPHIRSLDIDTHEDLSFANFISETLGWQSESEL